MWRLFGKKPTRALDPHELAITGGDVSAIDEARLDDVKRLAAKKSGWTVAITPQGVRETHRAGFAVQVHGGIAYVGFVHDHAAESGQVANAYWVSEGETFSYSVVTRCLRPVDGAEHQ